MLAHELRTPLNAILGFTQVLLSEIDGPVTKEQREDLAIIESAGQRLRSLFNSLLDFWEASFQSIELKAEARSVKRLLEGVAVEVGRLRPKREGKGTPVIVSADELELECDAQRLHRTIVAFADGALQHGRASEIRLTARERGPDIEIVLSEVGAEAASDPPLRIVDMEELADEAPATLMRSWPLALAKRVVEAHRGSLFLSPVEGHGVEVVLAIPKVTKPAKQSRPSPSRTRESNVVRSKVLAAMGHELKNPMNSITGFSDMLLSGAEGSLNHEQLKNLKIIRASSEHLLRLTTSMVDNARIEAHTLRLRREWVAPADLVQDATALIDARDAAAVVHTESGLALPSVYVDRERTTRALAALAAVAIKTTKGPISILARAHRYRAGDAPMIEFDVVGNKAATLSDQSGFAKLIETQFPATDSLSLDVFVARHVVELHGGRVWHETGSAGAFRVCLTLPTKA